MGRVAQGEGIGMITSWLRLNKRRVNKRVQSLIARKRVRRANSKRYWRHMGRIGRRVGK